MDMCLDSWARATSVGRGVPGRLIPGLLLCPVPWIGWAVAGRPRSLSADLHSESWNPFFVKLVWPIQPIILTSCCVFRHCVFRHWLSLLIKTYMLLNFSGLCEPKKLQDFHIDNNNLDGRALPPYLSNLSMFKNLWLLGNDLGSDSSALAGKIATEKDLIQKWWGSIQHYICYLFYIKIYIYIYIFIYMPQPHIGRANRQLGNDRDTLPAEPDHFIMVID